MLAATGIDQITVDFGRVANLQTNRIPLDARVDYSQRVSSLLRWSLGLDVFAGPVSLTFRGPRAPGTGSGVVASVGDLATVATQSTTFALRPGAWTDLEITPTRGLRLIPSLRLDYYGDIQRAVLSPRLAFRMAVAPGWALKGGIGLYTQPPQLQESLGAVDHAAGDGRSRGQSVPSTPAGDALRPGL